MSTKTKHIVILGTSADGKARACRFDTSQEGLVRKAAGEMHYRVGCPKSETASTLAAKLSEGKFEGSLISTPPEIDDNLFYRLVKHMTFDSNWNTAGVITSSPVITDEDVLRAQDLLWSKLTVGAVALVFDFSSQEAYGWNAVILDSISKDGKSFSARWRDWPGKPFTIERSALALLPPANNKPARP